MMNRQRVFFFAGAVGCVIAATLLLSTAPTTSTASSSTANESAFVERVEVKEVIFEGKQSHWSETYLNNLSADSSLDQSIYLSTVQITQLERDNGDVKRALPYLEELVTRTPNQNLKNALRRLIADIHREENNEKMQKNQLKKIIDESLLQL
jgi:Trp operon repressor